MVKHEIKVEISNTEVLQKLIEKAYFEDGQMGRIMGKENFLPIDESDDINYSIFKDLDGATAKVWNKDIIDGTMRFMVNHQNDEIKLTPVSIYCIKEEGKYIFY